MKRRQHLIALLEQQSLGDFQLKPLGRQAGGFQRIHHHGQEVAYTELQRRQINRHTHIVRPLRGVHTGTPQHQPADRIDETGFFRDGNEFAGRDHAVLVRPAHQCLQAGDAAALEIDQRLIIGLQHVAFDGGAQINLDATAALSARVHFRFKETERSEPFALGARQRHVGILEQLLGVVTVAGRNRDADAGTADDAVSVEQIRLADRRNQTARQHGDFFRPRDAGLYHGKFIGAETCDGVLFAQGRPQALGHTLEQLVADGMTQRIVDGLEVVEIEKQDRNLVAAAPGMRQQFIEPLTQQDAVRQAGQAVMLRHEGEASLGTLALGDVHQGQQDRRLALECQVT